MTGKSSATLEVCHAFKQGHIVVAAALSQVNPSMAGRAKRDHKPRIVRPAVAQSANVMRLEVGRTIEPQEGGRSFTAFAASSGARQHIGPYVTASLKHGPPPSISFWYVDCRRDSPRAQLGHAWIDPTCGRRVLRRSLDRIQRPELKDQGQAHRPRAVRRRFRVMRFANPFALVSEGRVRLLAKQEQALATGRMAGDRQIALPHAHVSELPLPEVLEGTVCTHAVSISVLRPLFAGYDYDQRVVRRGYDPALLLPSKRAVNVAPAIVGPASLERPSHESPPISEQPTAIQSGGSSTGQSGAEELGLPAEAPPAQIALLG